MAKISNVRSGEAHETREAPRSIPEQILDDANRVEHEKDARGRRIGVRLLDFLQIHRITCLMGTDANNEAAMGQVLAVCAVCEIDGDAVALPRSRGEVDALMKRLGLAGVAAAARASQRFSVDLFSEAEIKN